MSQNNPGDFGEAFRDMVTQWERSFDSFANQFMGTESFSRSMNQAQDAQLAAQKAFQEFMSRNLASAHLPTREDIVRLGESVHALDRRLARIEELLAEGQAPKSKKKGPPRTKKPKKKDKERNPDQARQEGPTS